MTIVVNDAIILIDLDFQFCTTDLVLEELHEHQKAELEPYIDGGQLQVQEISEEQLIEIVKNRMERPSLSEQDCSAFYQAQYLEATLITSDNTLRKFAKVKKLDVHGHLWVFDQMVIAKTLSPCQASLKLDELCDSINPKLNLPKKECELRKKKWQAI